MHQGHSDLCTQLTVLDYSNIYWSGAGNSLSHRLHSYDIDKWLGARVIPDATY